MYEQTAGYTGKAMKAAPCATERCSRLRANGITVGSAIGLLVATFCIARDDLLLHSDRDCDVFAAAHGLRVCAH